MTYIVLFIGLIFIFLEFYLPGSILALIGSLCVFFSLYMEAKEASTLFDFFTFCIIALLGVLFVIRMALSQIKRSGKKNTFLLEKDQTGYEGSTYEEKLIGKEGITLNDLRPSGFIFIDDKRYPAISQGTFIDKGTPIIVLSGEGSRLIVKAKKKEQSYERTD